MLNFLRLRGNAASVLRATSHVRPHQAALTPLTKHLDRGVVHETPRNLRASVDRSPSAHELGSGGRDPRANWPVAELHWLEQLQSRTHDFVLSLSSTNIAPKV